MGLPDVVGPSKATAIPSVSAATPPPSPMSTQTDAKRTQGRDTLSEPCDKFVSDKAISIEITGLFWSH